MVCILFIHQNFPGQFINISKFLSNFYNVHSMSFSNKNIKGITHHQCYYKNGNILANNNLCIEFESKIIRAEIVQKKCIELNDKNIIPDIVIAHSGWGESLLIKNIWPNTKLVSYMELYYEHFKEKNIQQKNKLTLRNSPYLLSLVESDYCISPTKFQKETFPKIFHDKIDIIFEGIDTLFFKKRKLDSLSIGKLKKYNKWKYTILPNNFDIINYEYIYEIKKYSNVITFISRDLTPLRGYDKFLEALPNILDKFPDTIVIIVGEDGSSYCENKSVEESYFKICWEKVEHKLHNKKIFFLGRVPQKTLIDIFSISTINVYITLPFCLSWSFMEGLATEVLMVTNNSKPMTDIVTNNVNCLLFEDGELDKKIISILENPSKFNYIRKAARELIVNNYNLEVTLSKYDSLIKKLL